MRNINFYKKVFVLSVLATFSTFVAIAKMGFYKIHDKMKTLIFIAFITFGIKATAQITMEHDYNNASTYMTGNPGLNDQLMIINFEVSGERYVKIDRHNQKINIYDLNHSLLNTIDCSSYPQSTITPYTYFLYFSEHLFDLDDGIEFMYCYNAGVSSSVTNIYKEDGTIIFSDTAGPAVITNVLQQQYPIYNTSQGTKMILSYPNGHAKVFSLPGTLSAGIAEANGQLVQMQNGQLNNLYPNPSNGAVTLQYELPKGEQQGELVLYNMLGKEVKRYKVDNTFKDILLDNTQLPAGTYFYQLQTSKGSVGTKRWW